MTRRKPIDKLVKIQPPNPANIARKLHRIKIEIVAITESIDRALENMARLGKPEHTTPAE